MATLDDKLLGEKLQYYYSSSEESGGEEDGGSGDEGKKSAKMPTVQPPLEPEFAGGPATHTGPKGVIADWRRFKQLETEKREEQDAEKRALQKRLTLSCRSNLDDEKADEEMRFLEIEDEFLKRYWQQRKMEMTQILREKMPTFGKVITLHRDNFVDAIDKESKHVTIMVHLTCPSIPACHALDGCFQCLAADYTHVKFCTIPANQVDVSRNFAEDGLPALLVYKGGELVGNFVHVSDQLGDDFFAMDVESFLQEHGLLPEKDEQKLSGGQVEEEDSDLDLD